MLAYYHLPSREALYMKLGQGSIDLSRYILKESPKTEQSLLSKLFGIKRTQQPQIVTVTPEKVNVKKTTPCDGRHGAQLRAVGLLPSHPRRRRDGICQRPRTGWNSIP